MNNTLYPPFALKLGQIYILWFQPSNRYLLISESIYRLLQFYTQSKDNLDFILKLQNEFDFSKNEATGCLEDIEELLVSSNAIEKTVKLTASHSQIPDSNLSYYYQFNNQEFRINYGSEGIKFLIHPQFAHLVTEPSENIATFDIFLDGQNLMLFIDKYFTGSFLRSEYHLLQGQFAVELLNILYSKVESDWVATFHASTITNGNEAIMLIGDSGNGKSTLTALLLAHGFDVVADDFTPLSADDLELYHYPAGISVKEGAFKTMSDFFPEFINSPTSKSPSKLGDVKYIAPKSTSADLKIHYPCSKVVFVKYDSETPSSFMEFEVENLLPTLINQSWLSPLPKNAKLFMNWVQNVESYHLSYSNNNFAVTAITNLFNVKHH